MEIITAIIILISVTFGYFLRDLHVKNIQQNIKKVEEKLRPKKSEVIEYQLPTSEKDVAEKIARENMTVY